ncbi:MAG: hypothetical protein ABSG43_02420 [Solirubrobacteraceae bacterium]|jgi:hypothetical protein
MKLNRTSITLGLVVGALAGGAGGALAATNGSTSTTSTTTTPAAAFGFGHGFFGAGHYAGNCGAIFSAAASYLGVSQSALQTQLQDGKTLAQVANTRGKSVSGLEDAMTTALTNSVNADSGLTAAQKSAILAQARSHVDAIVSSTCDHRFAGLMLYQ